MLSQTDRRVLEAQRGEVDLSRRGLTDEDCAAIVDILKPRLEQDPGAVTILNLSYNEIKDEGARVLFELVSFPIELDLRHNQITKKGFGIIIEICNNIPFWETWMNGKSYCKFRLYGNPIPPIKNYQFYLAWFWNYWQDDDEVKGE